MQFNQPRQKKGKDMSFKPEDLTEISMHAYIDEHFIINTIDKDKREAFLVEKLGSSALVEQIKELTASLLGDIRVWQSDYFDDWEVAECTYQDAFFLYPAGENVSYVISNIHNDYNEKQWAEKRYVVQEDDQNALRLDSKTVGLIVTALALTEASYYQGYNYDTRNMLYMQGCQLRQALDDAKYGLYGDDEGAELDTDVKYKVELMMDKVNDCLSLYGEPY